jgi:hypothetical protein
MDDRDQPQEKDPHQERSMWDIVPDIISRTLGGIERVIGVTLGSAFGVAILLAVFAVGTSIFYSVLRIMLRAAFDVELMNPFDGWQDLVPTI